MAAAAKKDKDAEARPDVEAGDELYFRHPKHGPTHGRVAAAGVHGCHIDCVADGVRYRVRWSHVLGHRIKVQPQYKVIDEGEDGMIVEDGGGRRRFLSDKPEEEEDSVAKSIRPIALIFSEAPAFDMMKAIKNGPGLSLQDVTDRTGKRTKRWKKTVEDAKQTKSPASPVVPARVAGPRAAKVGDAVGFALGNVKGNGDVVAAGKDGVTVRDASGHDHGVPWNAVEQKKTAEKSAKAAGGSAKPFEKADGAKAEVDKPKSPDYPPRKKDENDKGYMKRVVRNMPEPAMIPQAHARYFSNIGAATIVPMDKLRSTKPNEKNDANGARASRYMEAASNGKIGKRAPIKVTPNADGTFNILDGNGTFTSAKKNGWNEMPVTIAQPVNDEASLFAKSGPALESLRDWLNRGRGVCSQMGFSTATKKPKDFTNAEWEAPDGILFVAPIKAKDRSTQKVESDYDGDWSRLLDTVRCTIAVNTIADVKEMIERLHASGMVLAKSKDRMAKPTKSGYRDILMNVRMPNGIVAEVQVNVKDMMRAKLVGHHHYDISRALEGKHGSIPVASWPAEDRAAYEAAQAAETKLYGDAWSKVEKASGKP